MPVQIAKWDSARDAWTDESRIDLFSELSDVFLGTFPTSGMTVNGVAYELPTWEHHMAGSGYSSLRQEETLLQTPLASEGEKPSNVMGVERRQATGQVFLTNQIVSLCGLDPRESPLLKTPTAQLAVNGGSQHPDKRKAGGHGPTLADEVEHLLPTPRATRGGSATETVELLPTPPTSETTGAVMLLPTPKAGDGEMHTPMTSGRPVEKSTHLGTIAMLQAGHLEHRRTESLLPTPRATDGTKGGPNQRGSKGDMMLPSAVHQLEPTGEYIPQLFVDGKPCEEPPLPLQS